MSCCVALCCVVCACVCRSCFSGVSEGVEHAKTHTLRTLHFPKNTKKDQAYTVEPSQPFPAQVKTYLATTWRDGLQVEASETGAAVARFQSVGIPKP